MHKFAKQMADCLKEKVEGMGIDNIKGADLEEFKIWSEIIKNIVCYDKDYKVIEAMDKAKEEDEEDEKHFIKMLKEEYGMEDEEEAKRFYRGQPRSRTSGRFMSRGDGRRNNGGRRGYEEPMYFLPPEFYMNYSPEELRDLDRQELGRMYYPGGSSGGNGGGSGGRSASSMSGGNMGGNSGGSTRGYSDGYDEGQRRGYSEGYEQGSRDSRSQGGNSRYDKARRGYEEKKEMNKGNSPQENSENMKGLEELLNVVGGDVKELSPKMSPSEKAMTAQKFDTWSKMLKQ